MKRAYTLYVCSSCGDHYIFAGSCDCNPLSRLVARRVVPISEIEEFRDAFLVNSSPVPRWFIEHFVDSFLKFVRAGNKDAEGLRSEP